MRASQLSTRRRALVAALGGGATITIVACVRVAAGPRTAEVSPAGPTSPAGLPSAGGVAVGDAWARAATMGDGTANSAAYVTLLNQGGSPDVLVAAHCPVAAAVEVHRSTMEDGVMRMRPAGDVPLPPRSTVTMQPGGLHVMLMGLRQDLVEGTVISVTLDFQRAGPITIPVPVRAATSTG